MDIDQQALTIAQLDKLISERPDDHELKADLAFALMDEISVRFHIDKREKIQNSTIFHRLTAIAGEMDREKLEYPAEYHYFLAYIALINDDQNLFRKHLIAYLDDLGNEVPYNNDILVPLFIDPFWPQFEGMYKFIGEELNNRWPDCSAAMIMYGLEALHFEKDEDKALGLFSQVLDKDDSAWYAAWIIGRVYFVRKLWKSAIGYLRKALEGAKNYKVDAYIILARCYGMTKSYQLEEDAYRKCLDMDPEYPYALNNLGFALMRQKRFDEALTVFEQSILNGRDGTYPYRNKITVLKKMGRYDDAIQFISENMSKKKLGKSYEKEIVRLNQLISNGPNAASDDNLSAEPTNNEPEGIGQGTSRFPEQKAGSSLSKEWILEQDFENKILRNDMVFGRKLKMYETDLAYGRQYIIPGIGRLDLLTQEVDTNDFYIIELKKGKGDDEIIGQLARYMGWVSQNLVKNDEKVYGIICVHQVTEKLRLSAQIIPNVYLYEYGVHTKEVS